ncbi:MAG: hypothetical protein WBS54_02250 [Acidobacteriota bacterium]
MTWQWPEMPQWHPTTDEELHEKQAYLHRVNTLGGALIILGVIGGFIFGAFLQIQVRYNFSSWPKPFRFFTEPQGAVLVLLGLLALFFKFSRFGRNAEAFRPYFRAIGSYERAQKAFGRWKKSRRRGDLLQSHRSAEGAAWALKDVPEFMKFKQELQDALREAGLT